MRLSTILKKSKDSPDFERSFDYQSVIGKMNYIEKGSRSELAYAIHQCARYSTSPFKEHGDAVRWIGWYLLGTPREGLILKPDLARSFEVFVDSDFCGKWQKQYARNFYSLRSRQGYIIMYAGCPIVSKITSTNGNCTQLYRSGVYRIILCPERSHPTYGSSERNERERIRRP